MYILVTGGLGFIGSHTCVSLLEAKHHVVCLDNCANSKPEVAEKIKSFSSQNFEWYNIDLNDYDALSKLSFDFQVDTVIHFAGLKAVGESVERPLEYYDYNIKTTLNLLKWMKRNNVDRIVFSSSASVYGSGFMTTKEDMCQIGNSSMALSPYGRTKSIIELILKDTISNVTILRYFNPVGRHPSGLLFEDPLGIPNNLFPIIHQVIRGERDRLRIFGQDYQTRDGTCIRDYIHVMDLAKAHVLACDKMDGFKVYNVGTGNGHTIFEVLHAFGKKYKMEIPYEITERRPGDVGVLIADASKINLELGFKTSYNLEDMC